MVFYLSHCWLPVRRILKTIQRNGSAASHQIANIFIVSLAQIEKIARNGTLKQTFHAKVFFEKWNGNQKPKNKSQKRELGKDKWYNQIGQVGTSWSMWDKWDKEKGVFRS